MLIEDLKILIVEDEVLIAEYLKSILVSFEIELIEMAHDKNEALTIIQEKKFDLILLDIRMEEELQGIEIAREIQNNEMVPFIFLTAHSDVEIINKALETNPVSYLTKPLKKMDIFAALNLFVKGISSKENDFLAIKEGIDTIRLQFSEILFAKSIGNYIKIYTKNKSYIVRRSLDWLSQNLPVEKFSKAHRSYLVNKNKIDKINKKMLFIANFEIPISRNYASNFE